MKYDANIHHRRSIRLPGCDYSLAGWYFVTICTHDRLLLITNRLVRNIVFNGWHDLPRRFPSLRLDEFIIMPNHIHGIIQIRNRNPLGAQRDIQPEVALITHPGSQTERPPVYHQAAPLRPAAAPRSLGAIARAFKSVSTKRINRLHGTSGAPVWQRNYYERIIRNEDELNAIRQYIRDNPVKWAEDKNNPATWPNPP